MTSFSLRIGIAAALVAACVGIAWLLTGNPATDNREEVVFWHFWGGRDRDVVQGVVDRYNQSQQKYFVRAVAMPGNNLQAKLFLSVTGGDPPDLVNQDDPILADWSRRGVIQSIDSLASADEIEQLRRWLYPAAMRLSQVDGKLFGICNALDIRALYFNKTLLDQYDLQPPVSMADLNQICEVISPTGQESQQYYAFLPDSRRLWSWGFVFGGLFYENGRVRLATPEIQSALDWMQGFSKRYGPDNIAAFRQGDQSLPGKTFPLLPAVDHQLVGRYGLIMDGQWRTRDVNAFIARRRSRNLAVPEFGVCPLPCPASGRKDAGWVNGNFFVIPRGARNTAGAWHFIRYWIGLDEPGVSAGTCAAGGWIPVSPHVVQHRDFQEFIARDPLFAEFVRLAASPNQFPIPLIPGAPFFKRSVESVAYQAMDHPELHTDVLLKDAESRIQQHLDRQSDYLKVSRDD